MTNVFSRERWRAVSSTALQDDHAASSQVTSRRRTDAYPPARPGCSPHGRFHSGSTRCVQEQIFRNAPLVKSRLRQNCAVRRLPLRLLIDHAACDRLGTGPTNSASDEHSLAAARPDRRFDSADGLASLPSAGPEPRWPAQGPERRSEPRTTEHSNSAALGSSNRRRTLERHSRTS